MSDLQVYLLGLGAFIIIGVLVANRVQERRFKSKLNHQSEEAGQDPLLDQINNIDVVPMSDPKAESIVSHQEPIPETSSRLVAIDEGSEETLDLELLDSKITFQVVITATEGLCISTTGRLQEVLETIPKRHQIWGSTRKHKDPVIVSNPDSIFEKLIIAVQLTDRNGPLTREQIEVITNDINAETVPTGAIATQIKPEVEAERARVLKDFSDEVDLLFGLTVERPRGSLMSGAEVLSLSAALGMRLNRRGVFIMSDESGAELFTIENRDSTPFIEQEMNGKEIPGITFLLDVTMVEDGIKTFNKMAGVAKQFADAMNATICDDNSLVVTDSGLDLIRKQLGQIFKLMDEQEIRPGTLVAKQLFS